MVAICDHLRLLFLGKLERKIWREPNGISLYLFVQPFSGYTVDGGQIRIKNNPLVAHDENRRADVRQGAEAGVVFHMGKDEG